MRKGQPGNRSEQHVLITIDPSVQLLHILCCNSASVCKPSLGSNSEFLPHLQSTECCNLGHTFIPIPILSAYLARTKFRMFASEESLHEEAELKTNCLCPDGKINQILNSGKLMQTESVTDVKQ